MPRDREGLYAGRDRSARIPLWGLLLVWFVAKIVIALAYSIVGTATIFLGAQVALLAAGYAAVSELAGHRRALPIAYLAMIVIGWLWQLVSSRRRKVIVAPERHAVSYE